MADIITLKQICTELKLDRARLGNGSAPLPETPRSIPSWPRRTRPAHHGRGSRAQLARRKRARRSRACRRRRKLGLQPKLRLASTVDLRGRRSLRRPSSLDG